MKLIFAPIIVIASLISLLLTSGVLQAEDEELNRIEAIGVSVQTRDAVVKAVTAKLPDLPVLAVVKTPLAEMVSLELEGGQTIYATLDGKYILSGDLYQLDPEVVNLAEGRRSLRRAELMAKVPAEELVVFSPEGETKTFINVFTDVDCGYCRKLHQEVPELNARGIEVRYLAYPRAGFNTPTYDKIVSAWCAKDRQTAITTLKQGDDIPARQCENPVESHYQLGQQVGVTGTPAIVSASGMLLPGYMPADKLADAIGVN